MILVFRSPSVPRNIIRWKTEGKNADQCGRKLILSVIDGLYIPGIQFVKLVV